MAHEDDASRGDEHTDDAPDPTRPGGIGLGTKRAPDEPAWTKLLAPFRSEDAAFRALLGAAAVLALIVALVLLVRAL